ncbi:MAG TPA: RNA 2',3'-cyclic phosphodiesterase [Chthoniobacterales bacterium]|nr:RNA 2',3'-cyclic phosphodiesterase [Chthoniobacterales bacterium]
MSSKRLFVAIDLPESTAKLVDDLNPNLPGVRWTAPEQLHLTLSFLGHVPPTNESTWRERLSQIQFHPFFLPIAGTGTFPPKGPPKIIWIGVGKGHPHLFQIHKRVQEAALAAGLEPDLRSWHPHITLARCRDVSRGAIQPFLRDTADLDAGMIKVEAFHLYSSQLLPSGSVHTRELTVGANCG